MDMLFILGAPDPEMQAIESLLKECGVAYAYAVGPDGQRVHPGNAYKAENFVAPDGAELPETLDDYEVVEVECAVRPRVPGVVYHTADHHRPGDPGYGKPPAEFLSASSIGQVISFLVQGGNLSLPQISEFGTITSADQYTSSPSVEGRWFRESHRGEWAMTVEASGHDDLGPLDGMIFHADPPLLYAAAADHCLAAAYRGECPGVNSDKLMQWRIASMAAFQNRDTADVLSDVNAAREKLTDAYACDPVFLGEVGPECGDPQCSCRLDSVPRAADMRGQRVPELPEASARENICFVSDGLPGPDGRVKVVCQSGTPEQIQAFMSNWAPENGLVDVYGDPARGFAGGYVC